MTRAQRDALILRAHRNGWTYAQIADRYGVTRQRAWQIVTKAAPRPLHELLDDDDLAIMAEDHDWTPAS